MLHYFSHAWNSALRLVNRIGRNGTRVTRENKQMQHANLERFMAMLDDNALNRA